jgi:hypothetical protein
MTNQNIFSFQLSQTGNYSFFVTKEGLCQFNNHHGNSLLEEFALTAYSRISFLGCWLIFTSKGHSNKSKSTFIFKDSLSTKDYSRLKRVIVALK